MRAELIERQPQLEQRSAIHLDGDLLRWHAAELHDVQPAAQHFVLHLPRQRNEFVQAASAGDQNRRHQIAAPSLVHRRRFDLRRKTANLRNLLLDAIHRVANVRLGFDLHLHERIAVAGNAVDAFGFRDRFELVFQRRGDQLLHILRAGPAPSDFGVDVGARRVWIELYVQLGDGPDTSQRHQHHA